MRKNTKRLGMLLVTMLLVAMFTVTASAAAKPSIVKNIIVPGNHVVVTIPVKNMKAGDQIDLEHVKSSNSKLIFYPMYVEKNEIHLLFSGSSYGKGKTNVTFNLKRGNKTYKLKTTINRPKKALNAVKTFKIGKNDLKNAMEKTNSVEIPTSKSKGKQKVSLKMSSGWKITKLELDSNSRKIKNGSYVELRKSSITWWFDCKKNGYTLRSNGLIGSY